MSRYKSCLSVINTISGCKEARNAHTSSIQHYLYGHGFVHREVLVPDVADMRGMIDRPSTDYDVIVAAGGDGTVSSVVNMLALSPHPRVAQMPIVVCPAGIQNGIAHSLGIRSAGQCLSCFVSGREVAVPLWEVRVDGTVVRYIVGSVSFGTYCDAVSQMHRLKNATEEYVIVPFQRRRYTLAALYTALQQQSVAGHLTLTFKSPSGPSNGPSNETHGSSEKVWDKAVRCVLASQLPLQHSSYSLTPSASFRRSTMSVLVADEEATRWRLAHLLWHEARRNAIQEEDGVKEWCNVAKLAFRLQQPSCLVRLDGEPLQLEEGQELSVERTTQTVTMVVP